MAKEQVPLQMTHRLLEPGPVVLITTRYRDRINVMPAAWVTPVNLEPPLLGVAVAPENFTYELIWESDQFAVNIPGRALAEKVQESGMVSGREVEDKWESLAFASVEADYVDVPLIEECLAHLECAVIKALELEDHTFFVGEVLHAQAEAQAFDQNWLLEDDEAKPLHHLGGNLYAVLDQTIEIPLPDCYQD